MCRLIKDILTLFGLVLIFAAGLISVYWGVTTFTPQQKVYNCDLAEISPDFPIKAKEECRKLRSGRI